MPSRTSRRGLSTARAALQVAGCSSRGRRASAPTRSPRQLGKSVSTAYNLLVSLCDEGVAVHHSGGLYRLSPAFAEMVTSATAAPADELHDLSGVVAELLARTHKRSYLGILRAGELHVVARARRAGDGQAARARRAHRRQRPRTGDRQGDARDGLARRSSSVTAGRAAAVHAHTITDPDALRDDLREVRRRGYAVDCEEFDEDFCCIASAVLDPRGRFLAAIGISMTRRAFDDEHESSRRPSSPSPWRRRAGPRGRPSERLRHRPIPGIFRNSAGS